jgi:hypothetical protein
MFDTYKARLGDCASRREAVQVLAVDGKLAGEFQTQRGRSIS